MKFSQWIAAMALLVLRCAGGVRLRRRDRVFSLVGLAAAILVGVHALVDFSAQIPAVAVTFATLLGLGCAQAQGRSRAGRNDVDPEPAAVPSAPAAEPPRHSRAA